MLICIPIVFVIYDKKTFQSVGQIMSPVPEPTQGGRVGPGNGEEEEISPPMGLFVGPPVSSSDDEPEQTDVVEPYTTGYQPLSQDNDVVSGSLSESRFYK